MRAVVIANCQGEGVASALQAMNHGWSVQFIMVTAMHDGSLDLDKILSSADYIFAQKGAATFIPDEYQHKVTLFPTIAFDGYHPDICFIRGKKKGHEKVETVTSDMVIYHSSIAFFGYYYGISVDDILNHYNHFVMSRLGYTKRWDAARNLLLDEAEQVGMPIGKEFHQWVSQGCFMYSNNHPHIRVLADIARRIMKKIEIPIVNQNVTDYIPDVLKAMPVWPLYPQIAEKLDLKGDYTFKRHDPYGLMTLREFVERSYAIFDEYEKDSLESLMISPEEMAALIYADDENKLIGNPYKNSDRRQFWKNSVASVEIQDVDPVFSTSFRIGKNDKVATAGSCFAQHIARTLSKNGFNYYIPESAPPGLSDEEGFSRNYGVFSARYGNVYTVRQLVQLIERAYGRFVPDESWWTNKNGSIVDPFRPQIEPSGFDSLESAETSRNEMFAAIRSMFENLDVFIFTLGLTEGWRSKVDGAVFPLAPGVAGGVLDFDKYEFVNFTVEEVISDLFKAIDLIREINKNSRIILTVSPVPLIATYEKEHALLSTMYSKSVLRVAAQRASFSYKNVDYFGSYELINSPFNKGLYFHDDLRSVKEEGVSHVMKMFMKNYTRDDDRDSGNLNNISNNQDIRSRNLFDIVCDEEAIANF